MQNNFAKMYLYILIGVSAVSFLSELAYILTKITAFGIPIILCAFAELAVLIMSIIMIVKVFTKKLNRINLVLPVFYVLSGIALLIYEILAGPDTGDLGFMDSILAGYDLSLTHNLITFYIDVAYYIFLIGFGIYLLRTNDSFRQEQ